MRIVLSERLQRLEDEILPYFVSENGRDWHLSKDAPPKIVEHWKEYKKETDKLFRPF